MMESSARHLRPYQTPRLKVYGTVRDLTLSATLSMNKNDAVQGHNNLKT
jgi:hypothetical protein